MSSAGEGAGEEHECPTCGRSFGTRQGLGQHHSSVHGMTLKEYRRSKNADHDCPSCEMAFSTRQGLGQHHSRSHGEKLRAEVSCSDCGTALRRKYYQAEAHDNHFCAECSPKRAAGGGGECACPSCGESFQSPMRLGMHHSSEHGTTLQEHRRTIDAEHNCPSCDMAFRTRQGLGQHHSRSHGVSIRDLEKQQRATHECPTCGEMLGSRNLVGIHHSEEHGETLVEHRQRSSNGVECPSCDRCDFSSEYALKQHHAKAHDRSLNEPEHRPVECEWPDCGERFDTTANMRIHHGHAHGSTRVELVCVECGEDFEVSRWAAENGQEHCSPQCSGDAQYERVTVSCDWCGDDVEKIPAEAERRDHHFCKNGEGCEDKWRSENFSGEDSPVWTERVEVTCEWCDSAFTKPRYQAKVVDMHFCDLESVDSPSCFSQWASENRVGPNHPLWDGGWFPYGPGWGEAKKELVRERDGRECRVCGKSEAAHLEEHDEKHTIHHIVKARVLQDAPAELRNGPFNLVTICRDHHLNKWEEVPVLLQFMAFLPHPPLPMEQVELAAFAAED